MDLLKPSVDFCSRCALRGAEESARIFMSGPFPHGNHGNALELHGFFFESIKRPRESTGIFKNPKNPAIHEWLMSGT